MLHRDQHYTVRQNPGWCSEGVPLEQYQRELIATFENANMIVLQYYWQRQSLYFGVQIVF